MSLPGNLLLSPAAAEKNLELQLARAHDLGGTQDAIHHAWRHVHAGTRDMLAYQRFEQLVRETTAS